MKRFTSIAAALIVGLPNAVAQSDSLNVELSEATVIATRATQTTPIAFTNVSAKELSRSNFGADIPTLLSTTPSCISTSDAGAGIGYSSLRIRGVDATRINVTINGIPLNDAESHNVFWVNTPDLASSVNDIQVQRGVGTSTNGSGAFGASLGMQTSACRTRPYTEVQLSGGSYNTHKETLNLGTGLINKHWTFDARLSNIGTDGYIDRAEADLYSYYTQAGYFADATALRLIVFGGKERTYHAWNYASREEMEQYGRRYNSCGYMYTDDNGVQHFYDDQTDNYEQTHYQFLGQHQLSKRWKLNAALHYTRGKGYYQEYKTDRKLVEYGLTPYTLADGTLVKKSDLIRRKSLDNDFGGGNVSINYRGSRLNATLGAAASRYVGNHFGHVLWTKNYLGALDPNTEYYRSQGRKTDANIFLKGEYALLPSLSAYADLQIRHIDYRIAGTNDKYNSLDASGMQRLDIDEQFDFFNPKVGLNWNATKALRLFASASIAHKEPTRNNYTDGYFTQLPRAEKLVDYEAGAHYTTENFHIGANLYFMDYTDQLVLTGALNEIGEPVSANVKDSYRMGVELQTAVKFPFGLKWEANATLSKNRIRNFSETLYGYDADWNELPAQTIEHGSTHIAFSPSLIASQQLSYEYKGFFARLSTQYVGEQYMSNADVAAHKLEDYCISNLDLAYTFRQLGSIESATIGFRVNNLFNKAYENNGWASSEYLNTPDNRVNYTGYAAQARTNFMAHLTLKF